MIIGYTGGTFDVCHVGHVNFLKECKKYCERLFVSLNTDEFIEAYKGKPPVFSYMDREQHLYDTGYVDEVIPNDGGADSKPAIMAVDPHIILIGSDWAVKDYYKQMGFDQEWLNQMDITLAYIPYYQHISTTKIKEACLKSLS
jgi:glycerol-3-phosphate cytidylyltransferase